MAGVKKSTAKVSTVKEEVKLEEKAAKEAPAKKTAAKKVPLQMQSREEPSLLLVTGSFQKREQSIKGYLAFFKAISGKKFAVVPTVKLGYLFMPRLHFV